MNYEKKWSDYQKKGVSVVDIGLVIAFIGILYLTTV